MNIKDFAEKFFKAEEDAFQKGDFDTLAKLEDSKVVYHLVGINQELTGFEAHKQNILDMRQAAPGIRAEWRYIIGEGNLFSALFKTSGAKFTGTVPGLPPPTGKEIIANSLFLFRLNKGKIVDAWSNGTVTGWT